MKRDKSFDWQRVDASRIDFAGKKVAIVGGTGGIGRAISRFLASRGANVMVVGQTFRDTDISGIRFIHADLSLMNEAQRVALLLPAETLDLVIFTTGIFAASKRQATAEGIERDLAVSYLNRLVILREIAPQLGMDRTGAQMKTRVFIMGYPGGGQTGTYHDLNAEQSYSAMAAHMNTVAGNEILVSDAVKKYPHANFYGLNPGLIKTNIRSNFLGDRKFLSSVVEELIGLLMPSADAYAKRIAPLLFSPDIEEHSGALFDQKARPILPSSGLTQRHINGFIAASEALLVQAGVR